MGDPAVVSIDRALMRGFQKAVMTLPQGLHLAKRRHPKASVMDLVALDKTSPRMTPERANHYVAKVGEAFGWAVREKLMTDNPAHGLIERPKRRKREQD